MSLAKHLVEHTPPRAAGLTARVVPAPIWAALVALMTNILLGMDKTEGALDALSGAHLCLEITAPALKLGFVVREGRLWPVRPDRCDVCIRGDIASFLALLRQTDDADALFFDRQLAVEGKTDIALHIRHVLEGAIYRRRQAFRKPFALGRKEGRKGRLSR